MITGCAVRGGNEESEASGRLDSGMGKQANVQLANKDHSMGT